MRGNKYIPNVLYEIIIINTERTLKKKKPKFQGPKEELSIDSKFKQPPVIDSCLSMVSSTPRWS